MAEGRIQGTVPTPIGLLAGHAEAGFVRNDEMLGDTSLLSVGVEGSCTQPGVGTIGGSIGDDRIDVFGDVSAPGLGGPSQPAAPQPAVDAASEAAMEVAPTTCSPIWADPDRPRDLRSANEKGTRS